MSSGGMYYKARHVLEYAAEGAVDHNAAFKKGLKRQVQLGHVAIGKRNRPRLTSAGKVRLAELKLMESNAFAIYVFRTKLKDVHGWIGSNGTRTVVLKENGRLTAYGRKIAARGERLCGEAA